MNILTVLPTLFGKLMYFIYYFLTFENYGFALIVFTFLTRLAMLPLTIKQYKGTAKMQRLAPRLEEIRKQYGTDKQRLNEETLKLYQQEKYNPASGCLPLLIQMPILFSLYPVVTQPLHYIVGKSQETIAALKALYATISGSANQMVQEVEIMTFFKNNADAMGQAEAAGLLNPAEILNMNFFGLDLSRIPTYNPNLLFGEQAATYLPLLLIPLIGVVSTWLSGKISMASTAAQNAANPQASSMSKSMQLIGPVMTLMFSFQLPTGVLIYWTAGYIIQIIQQLYINKFVLKLDNIFTGEGGSSVMREEEAAAKRARIAQGKAGAKGAISAGGTAALDGAAAGTDGTGGVNASGKGGRKLIGAGKQDAAEGIGAAGAPAGEAAVRAAAASGRVSAGESSAGSRSSKVTGVGVSGGAAVMPGKKGLVHGGVLETKLRIPGLVNPSDEEWPVGEAETAVDGTETAGSETDASEDIEDTGDAGRRARGVDTRSATNRNYGSQKRKKKK